jgi:hypothetical protein
VRAVTETSESVRRCVCRSGEWGRRFGVEGERTGDDPLESPYGDLEPAPRSGLAGKMGMPGEKGALLGERGGGGSIGTGDSLRRANLTVWEVMYVVEG